ncbi:hypothetical protein Tco_1080734 [Tanacetum coccineum]|uniref:Uncharacterized protein n=1 Tax=Tanacetum coccineum TaxID=301880 RepID=A0ABQ5HWT7_9ASTR
MVVVTRIGTTIPKALWTSLFEFDNVSFALSGAKSVKHVLSGFEPTTSFDFALSKLFARWKGIALDVGSRARDWFAADMGRIKGVGGLRGWSSGRQPGVAGVSGPGDGVGGAFGGWVSGIPNASGRDGVLLPKRRIVTPRCQGDGTDGRGRLKLRGGIGRAARLTSWLDRDLHGTVGSAVLLVAVVPGSTGYGSDGVKTGESDSTVYRHGGARCVLTNTLTGGWPALIVSSCSDYTGEDMSQVARGGVLSAPGAAGGGARYVEELMGVSGDRHGGGALTGQLRVGKSSEVPASQGGRAPGILGCGRGASIIVTAVGASAAWLGSDVGNLDEGGAYLGGPEVGSRGAACVRSFRLRVVEEDCGGQEVERKRVRCPGATSPGDGTWRCGDGYWGRAGCEMGGREEKTESRHKRLCINGLDDTGPGLKTGRRGAAHGRSGVLFRQLTWVAGPIVSTPYEGTPGLAVRGAPVFCGLYAFLTPQTAFGRAEEIPDVRTTVGEPCPLVGLRGRKGSKDRESDSLEETLTRQSSSHGVLKRR